jgi:formyl-CoA transferase/succinyl-CoA--D-citramalate CoA-transferase
VGISLGDSLAATQGFIGALMALLARDRPGGSGEGQVVDVALYEAMWMYMESTLPEYEKLGNVRTPSGSVLPGIAPSNVYPTRDADWVIIGANQDSVFARLAELAGHQEWSAPGSRYQTHLGRGTHQGELDDELTQWTSGYDSAELLKLLAEGGVPSGRIYTSRDISTDEHFLARDMILDVAEPTLDGEIVREPGVVPKLSATPGSVRRGSPLLGEHNDEVLGQAVGHDRFGELRAAGVV